jgi:hypothetical protein
MDLAPKVTTDVIETYTQWFLQRAAALGMAKPDSLGSQSCWVSGFLLHFSRQNSENKTAFIWGQFTSIFNSVLFSLRNQCCHMESKVWNKVISSE